MAVDWAAVAQDAVASHHAVQKPAELAGLLELAAERRVRLVLEIGSDGGGTIWAWRQLPAEVLAVSLPSGPFSSGESLRPHGATVISGDSHALGTWLQVREVLAGRLVDLLFIDADHTVDGVTRDLMAYVGLVRPGGLVALHDIVPHPGKPEVGVWQVWKQLAGAPRVEFVTGPAWRVGAGIGVLTVGEGGI